VIAAAILTGGQARRLRGRDKSRLVPGADGRTILDRQLELLAPFVSEIFVVTSEARLPDFAALPSHAGLTPLRIVADHYPGTGPLGAVLTALEAASGGDVRDVLVVAGDMPALTEGFVRSIIARHEGSGNEITVPQSSRGLEPLAAIYGRSAYAALLSEFNAGERALHRAVRSSKAGTMPAPDDIFHNINTPDDLP